MNEIVHPIPLIEAIRELGIKNPGYCYLCAKCTSACPVAKASDFRPHTIMCMVGLGLEGDVLRDSSFLKCTYCQLCTSRCPQGVDTAGVMTALKNMYCEKVTLLKGQKAVLEVLKTNGFMALMSVTRKRYGISGTIKKIPFGLKFVFSIGPRQLLKKGKVEKELKKEVSSLIEEAMKKMRGEG